MPEEEEDWALSMAGRLGIARATLGSVRISLENILAYHPDVPHRTRNRLEQILNEVAKALEETKGNV